MPPNADMHPDQVSTAFAVATQAHGRSPHKFGNTALKLFAVAIASAFVVTAGAAQAATFSITSPASSGAFEPVSLATSGETDASATPAIPTVRVINYSGGPTSRLPESSTWAMLIMGFGAAGAAMRRRHSDMTYRLEECVPQGGVMTEEFAAPDDDAALNRAASVVAGDFKLWRGDVLVRG